MDHSPDRIADISADDVEVAIVGAGPAGLMAAETAARTGARVRVFEAMPSVGRKFLMAGLSGLNITHSEDFEAFVRRYGVAADWMRPKLTEFSPTHLREFCAGLGIETFVGASGRVFPTTMKTSPILRAWLARLGDLGVAFSMRSRFVGLTGDGALEIVGPDGLVRKLRPKAVVLALGGASWPRLGSTGRWTDALAARGVALAPFRPANCGIEIDWSDNFRARFEGAPIKTARFSFGKTSVRGEATITRRGLEGGPIYALSLAIGEELRAGYAPRLTIDLKPDSTIEALEARLTRRRPGDSLANALRKTLGLTPAAIALLREAGAVPTDGFALATLVKAVALPVRRVAGLERAISTAGGVRLDEVDDGLMLKKLPGVFVAGEMLDWDAPTGGYLLQACFATGLVAGRAAALHRADASVADGA